MLALIGGLMLLCAVSAMWLLATWSITRDDEPDSTPRDGLLALVHERGAPRPVRQEARVIHPISPRVDDPEKVARAKRVRRLRLDAGEMEAIGAEAKRDMPEFLRDAHEMAEADRA